MEELGGCVWCFGWWSVEDWVFDERVAKVLVFEEEDGFSFCIFVYLNRGGGEYEVISNNHLFLLAKLFINPYHVKWSEITK
jgi:hypothetical protein